MRAFFHTLMSFGAGVIAGAFELWIGIAFLAIGLAGWIGTWALHFARKKTPEAQVREVSAGLARELSDFIEERKRDHPTNEGHPLWNLPESTPPAEVDRVWREWQALSKRFDEETMRRFTNRYAARVLAHFDDLMRHDLINKMERPHFERPHNWGVIENMASAFAEVGAGGRPADDRRIWTLVEGVPGAGKDEPA